MAPPILNLAMDYARYGLTASMANEIINSRFENRRDFGSNLVGKPAFIVLHIQDGTTMGSLQYWASPDIDASSTVMANRDGSILRIVPETHGPWTNGDVMNPTAEASEILSRGGNPNIWTLSIEAEGKPYDEKTAAQLDAIEWQCRDWMTRYSIPLNHVLRHGWINSVTRSNCPGNYFNEIITRLGATGGSTLNYPAGWDAGIASAVWASLIGDKYAGYRFNEKGTVSRLWLNQGILSPLVYHFKDTTDGRELFAFAGGKHIGRLNSSEPFRVMEAV